MKYPWNLFLFTCTWVSSNTIGFSASNSWRTYWPKPSLSQLFRNAKFLSRIQCNSLILGQNLGLRNSNKTWVYSVDWVDLCAVDCWGHFSSLDWSINFHGTTRLYLNVWELHTFYIPIYIFVLFLQGFLRTIMYF